MAKQSKLSSSSKFRDFWVSALCTLIKSRFNSFNSLQKSHFGRLHLRSYSYDHYPRLMTVGKDGNENYFENWELFQQFSFHDNRIMQSLHHCTNFAHSSVQFFVLRHLWILLQDTWMSSYVSVMLHSLAMNTDQCFSKDEVPVSSTSVLVVLILSHHCNMQLQRSHLMHVGDQIQWKKAKSDYLRTTNNWSCNFQLWHTHWFDYAGLSSSCKLWKGEETKTTLVWDQCPQDMALIAYHWHKHRLLIGSRKTSWQATAAHQCHTLAKPCKV